MVQCLKVYIVLPDTMSGESQVPVTSTPRRSDTSGLHGQPELYHHVYIPTEKHIYTHDIFNIHNFQNPS